MLWGAIYVVGAYVVGINMQWVTYVVGNICSGRIYICSGYICSGEQYAVGTYVVGDNM